MPYQAEISRSNPSCILITIDQSGSMKDPFGGDEGNKIKAVGCADAINRLIQNLVIKCAKSEGVRDYYQLGVIGYGQLGVGPAFTGSLAGKELVPISLVANSPSRIEERNKTTDDGAGGLICQKIKFPIWFEPVAEGGTPMCEALRQAERIVSGFLSAHNNCYPPIVINITDGESTDGDPLQAASEIKGLSSTDGNVLLFNLHISSSHHAPIQFPDSEDDLPDNDAKLLFKMSSLLPDHMWAMVQDEGILLKRKSAWLCL